MSRHTHTYVTLDVSASAYDEIATALRAADYGHCFNAAGEIDMTGIALVRKSAPVLSSPRVPGRDKGKMWMADDFDEELVIVSASEVKDSAVERTPSTEAATRDEAKT